MGRASLLVLLACVLHGGASSPAQEPAPKSIDAAALQRWRRMPHGRRAKLRSLFRKFQGLPAEEKERLRENLNRLRDLPPERRNEVRSRFQKLTPGEKKDYAEVASSFFRFGRRRGLLKGFPRGMYFTWLKNTRPGAIDRIRVLDPEGRKEVFVKLCFEFRRHCLERLAESNRRTPFLGPQELEALRAAPAHEFWTQWNELRRRARRKGPSRPGGGPLAPREGREGKRPDPPEPPR